LKLGLIFILICYTIEKQKNFTFKMEGRDRIPVVEIEGRAKVLKNNLWQVKLGLTGGCV